MSNLYKMLKEAEVMSSIKLKLKPIISNIIDLIAEYLLLEEPDTDILDELVTELNKIISLFNSLGFSYTPDGTTDEDEEVFRSILDKFSETSELFLRNFKEDDIETYNVQVKYLLNLIDIHRVSFMKEGEVLIDG